MKKIKLFSLTLIVCLLMSIASPAALALEDPGIEAKAAVLVDLDTGRVLYDLNMDQQRSPASLTKVMTVLLALEAPFHNYYMTVSGHMNYNFPGNAMARKHKAEVADLEMSDSAKAYLAGWFSFSSSLSEFFKLFQCVLAVASE